MLSFIRLLGPFSFLLSFFLVAAADSALTTLTPIPLRKTEFGVDLADGLLKGGVLGQDLIHLTDSREDRESLLRHCTALRRARFQQGSENHFRTYLNR